MPWIAKREESELKLGNEIPVDATAARVISGGASFEFRANETDQDSELPLPITAPTKAQLLNPSFKDFTSIRLGRLVVIGISADRKARWVCKCVCGCYVLRSTAAIKAAAPDAACTQCYLLAVAKRKDFERRTGRESPTRSFLK